jgi:hypothetical protein
VGTTTLPKLPPSETSRQKPFHDVWKAAFALLRGCMTSKVVQSPKIHKGLHLLETCARPARRDLEEAMTLVFAISKWRERGHLDQRYRLRMQNLYK